MPAVLAALVVVVGLNVYLYSPHPKGFFPQQDTGRMMGGIQADQASRSRRWSEKIAGASWPSCAPTRRSTTSSASPAAGSATPATMFISLKPCASAALSADQVIARLRLKLATNPAPTCSWRRPRTSASAAGKATRLPVHAAGRRARRPAHWAAHPDAAGAPGSWRTSHRPAGQGPADFAW